MSGQFVQCNGCRSPEWCFSQGDGGCGTSVQAQSPVSVLRHDAEGNDYLCPTTGTCRTPDRCRHLQTGCLLF